MTYVVDASVAVEYLLRTELGIRVAPLLEGSILVAPSLLDVEVMSVLRRATLRRVLDEARALDLLQDLRRWPLVRIPTVELLEVAWTYRENVSAYDAFYVASASAYSATLLTSDGPLSRAPALGILIQNVRL